MPLHFTSHFSPSGNCIISLTYIWLFHWEGVTCYEPKTSFGSFRKWFHWGPIQMETGEWRPSQFPYWVGRDRWWWNPTQVMKSRLRAEKAWGGRTHFTERLHEGIHFLCPQFFLLIILIVVHMTLYLKCRKVNNNFNPVAYYGGGKRKHTLHLFTEWTVGA